MGIVPGVAGEGGAYGLAVSPADRQVEGVAGVGVVHWLSLPARLADVLGVRHSEVTRTGASAGHATIVRVLCSIGVVRGTLVSTSPPQGIDRSVLLV